MLLCQVYFLFALAFQKFSSYASQIFYNKFFHTCILHTAYIFGLGFLQCFKHSGFETFLRYTNVCIKCLHSVQNILFYKFIFLFSKNKIILTGVSQEDEKFISRFWMFCLWRSSTIWVSRKAMYYTGRKCINMMFLTKNSVRKLFVAEWLINMDIIKTWSAEDSCTKKKKV
jgi:hypothetical protein